MNKQDVYLRVHLGSILRKAGEENRKGQREKLSCNVLPTKASANSTGKSGATLALQSCSKLGQGSLAFMPLCWSVDMGYPWKEVRPRPKQFFGVRQP